MSDAIVTSASQLEVFLELCPRKWWFRKVRELPDPKTSAEHYGTVLHSVHERYYKADDAGRDENGEPVELYPDGWSTGLLPLEVKQIQRLFAQAIEQGMVYRAPGRLVEKEFRRKVGTPEGDEIRGYIDLVTPEEVVDHKSRKSRRYAYGPAKLKRDVQMLTYAQELRLSREEAGMPTLDRITVAHHYFIKEGRGSVFRVEESVTPHDLDAMHLRTVQALTEMRPYLGTVDDQWPSVEGPRPKSDACNAFGGCPYRRICSTEITVAQYRAQILTKPMASATIEVEAILRRDVPMATGGVLELLKSFRQGGPRVEGIPAGNSGAAPTLDSEVGVGPPPPAVPFDQRAPINPDPVEITATPPESSTPQRMPPWYQVGCRACQGNPFPGFDSNLRACRVCDSTSIKAKPPRPTSTECAFYLEDDEVPSWMEGGVRVRASEILPVDPIVQSVADAIKSVGPDGSDRGVVQNTEDGGAVVDALRAPGVGPRRRGRPKGVPNKPKEESKEEPKPTESFTIDPNAKVVAAGAQLLDPPHGLLLNNDFAFFRGCRPVRGAVELIELSELLSSLGTELASDTEAPSYYAIDAFKRRDMLAAASDGIVERLAGKVLYVPVQLTPDEQALAAILRPRACFVVDAA